ncbi:SRPBCC family protein [Flavicella sediminum]|uniref:SRPBCC family protein n=1 Tax=Flavicella sediminum TaxID=2585141 RepID=UPI00111D4A1F|nr:SRPBCC family protein [Flavicella sediminum]
MQIEGKKITAWKGSEDIFGFLTKLENYEQLMPENTEKFQIDGDSFIFGLKGMPEIRLIIKETTPNTSVILGAASSKMPFTLAIAIAEISENSSEIQLLFNGDFNPMISMMAKKPLTKFIEALTENIEKL